MKVNFEIAGKKFTGLNGGPHFKMNPSNSFFVYYMSIDQTNETWNKLIEGGKSLIPLEKYPGSERYDWVEDQFGLCWQITFSRFK